MFVLSSALWLPACTSDTDRPDPGSPPEDTAPEDTAPEDTSPEDTAPVDTGVAEDVVRVVLLGGQSNMSGRADAAGLPDALRSEQADVEIYYGGEEGSVEADRLLPLQPGTGADFGPEVTLGRALADAFPDDTFALIKYARGGTNLFAQWDPTDGPEYARFVDTVDAGLQTLVDAGLTPRIEGMVWHQGESDAVAGRTEAEYRDDLTELIEAVRSDVPEATDMRFVVGRLSDLQVTGSMPAANRDAVQAGQDAVAATVPDVGLVFTDSFRLNSDNLHFDAIGQHAMGIRFAQELVADRASSVVARFDLGIDNGNPVHQDGWTPFDVVDDAAPPVTASDPATGFTLTLDLDPGDPGLVSRDRGALDATTGQRFTLPNVYRDFVNVDVLSIGNLDPSKAYDVQLIMFDDHANSNRTQTAFDVTSGARDELGTTHGPGSGVGAILSDDHAFSLFGTHLQPDSEGTITLQITNTAVFAALVNGVVVTER